ncbi:protein SHI RELATED SEQUENCE 1-like isoform X1 [Curcuma longa]|uniref:protein SHI RELATED SEQUENCE 1-like isoform X1 n=1 Tax=Curcuma longa TaxID=136217 RepID=UPI003D9F97DF
MSSGFPFGGGRGDGGGIPPTESFFLYGGRGGGSRRDPEIGGSTYTRGFELTWQQQQIGQQQQHYSAAVGFPGDLPLVAGPRSEAGRGIVGGHSCQDCGNQAKKDCSHLRCRTCCKSRGFQCSTHVKSTWVPASKRRERQQQLVAAAAAAGESSKRSREIVVAATTTTTYAGGSQNHELFPAEVNAEAMFRCVRVSPVDEAEEEYAYQTTVSIAGHVFKGVLYDHGAAGPGDLPSSSSSRYQLLTHGEDSSSPATTGAAPIANASASDAANTAATAELLEPYPTPLSAFVAGTPFFPHQRYRPS